MDSETSKREAFPNYVGNKWRHSSCYKTMKVIERYQNHPTLNQRSIIYSVFTCFLEAVLTDLCIAIPSLSHGECCRYACQNSSIYCQYQIQRALQFGGGDQWE
jgi:hypothetical protein